MRERFCVSSVGLSRAFDFVASAVQTAGLPESVGQKIAVIVDEVCSNMIRHNSALSECDSFELDLIPGYGETKLIISDAGLAFDPLNDRPQENGDVGGHGISIIRGLASDVTYRRARDRNVLTVTLPSI